MKGFQVGHAVVRGHRATVTFCSCECINTNLGEARSWWPRKATMTCSWHIKRDSLGLPQPDRCTHFFLTTRILYNPVGSLLFFFFWEGYSDGVEAYVTQVCVWFGNLPRPLHSLLKSTRLDTVDVLLSSSFFVHMVERLGAILFHGCSETHHKAHGEKGWEKRQQSR